MRRPQRCPEDHDAAAPVCPPILRRKRRWPLTAWPVPVAALLISAACSTADRTTDDEPRVDAPPDGTSVEVPSGVPTLEDELETRYVIGPRAARQLGYRIDWQQPSYGRALKMVVIQEDSVFTLDDQNVLTRLRREEGDRMWRLQVASATERILGINYVPDVDRIFLTAGSHIIVLDAVNGSQVGKQRLSQIASTAPIEYGQFFVYGSRSGQLVWHAYLLDSQWRAYQVSKSIQLQPIYDDGYLMVVGNDGRIMSLLAGSASQVWSKRALAPIVARPVAGNGAAYVASLDQHLRAYELAEARSPLWEYLTESPLTDSPTLVGDHVYQQVAGQGLLCLEALPLDSPGGVLVWTNDETEGSVLTTREGELLVWDGERKRMDIVDARLGAVIDSSELAQVQQLITTGVERGNLYVTAADGRIERLVMRR